MTPSQETSPEPFPHEERAMDRLLEALGVRARLPRRRWSRGGGGRGPAGRRAALIAVVVAAIATVPLEAGTVSATGAASAGACSSTSSVRHVAVVVEHADGRTLSRCARFSGTAMTAEQVLAASGIEYQVQSYGSLGDAACQIDEEPASYTQCLPSSGSYWAVFVAAGGAAWQQASKGISEQTLHAGDGLGFRYDPESASTAAPPSVAAPATCTPALGCGATPQAGPARPSSGGGVSPALIAALIVGAALVVLLATRLVLRRRSGAPAQG